MRMEGACAHCVALGTCSAVVYWLTAVCAGPCSLVPGLQISISVSFCEKFQNDDLRTQEIRDRLRSSDRYSLCIQYR